MTYLTFGTNVKKLRVSKKWSQEKLAWMSGLCVSTISKVERGRTNPTSDVMESIAAALGASVAALLD